MHTVILVPTRNRPDLAAAAVRSVIGELATDAEIVVSDNSTDDAHRVLLRGLLEGPLEGPAAESIRLISPPEPLAMTAHWTWALDEVLATTKATHVAVLTDRMVFRPGGLTTLLQTAALYPDEVISYNHDRLDDAHRPVILHLEEWSGRLVRIRSSRLLEMASNSEWHPALPRMLNNLVPLATFDAIRDRFGSVFASNAPDHSFAYRCLAVRDSILYLDQALMVHYALDRSNGASYERGIPSDDNLDFIGQLGAARMNGWAPVPEFHTAMNAIVSEYCFVRKETGDAFPPIDMSSYLDAMEYGITQLEDIRLRKTMETLLTEADARHSPHRTLVRRLRRLGGPLAALKDHHTRALRLGLERSARAGSRHVASKWLVRQLDELGLLRGGPRTETLAASDGALEAALRASRRPNPHATHLLKLANKADLRESILVGAQRASAARRQLGPA